MVIKPRDKGLLQTLLEAEQNNQLSMRRSAKKNTR